MNTIKTFETDCHTVVDRTDINLKGLRYVIEFAEEARFDQKLLTLVDSRETLAPIFGTLLEWAYDGSDSIGFSEEDFLDYSEYNPFDLDRREDALAILSTEHPRSASLHPIIKNLIPTHALEVLAANGYQDCSYGNDETPSFYVPSNDTTAIYTHDDVNDEGVRVSDKISYAVFIDVEHIETFDTIEEAIAKATPSKDSSDKGEG